MTDPEDHKTVWEACKHPLAEREVIEKSCPTLFVSKLGLMVLVIFQIFIYIAFLPHWSICQEHKEVKVTFEKKCIFTQHKPSSPFFLLQEYFAHDLLKSKFNASIIGQHIAFKQILEATSEASHRNQILVFGLIGSPGTGKSLLSQLLVQTFMQRVHQVQSVADLNDNLIQNLLRTCSSDLVVIDNSVVSTFDLRKVQLFIDRLKRNKIQAQF